MSLYIKENLINRDENYQFEESDVYDTGLDTKGELFKRLQQEYGRCVSRVYIDTPNEPKPIGWVFESTQNYEDTGEPYTRAVWVTVHSKMPIRTIQYHYA